MSSCDIPVPPVDSPNNNTLSEVIGNKADTALGGTSIAARVNGLFEHAHSAQFVFPELADGVTAVTGAAAWQLGAIVEIVPAGALTDDFDFHGVYVEDAPGTTMYEGILYAGAIGAEVEIGRFKYGSLATPIGQSTDFQCKIQPPGTRISYAIASATGGGETMRVSLRGHSY